MTEKLRDDVLLYWRDTKKDKDALVRTSELFDITIDEVKDILNIKTSSKARFWNDENVFRLKAYIAQGMGNTEIAKQLGCKPQAVADYKRRCGLTLKGKKAKSKKKEPPAFADTESPKKNNCNDTQVSSVNNYNTINTTCQEQTDCVPATVPYEDYYKIFSALNNTKQLLHTAGLILETARRAGSSWHITSSSKDRCCEMYEMLIVMAIDKIRTAEGE